MGMGIGAAMTGLRPIVEGMNMGFLLLAFNQVNRRSSSSSSSSKSSSGKSNSTISSSSDQQQQQHQQQQQEQSWVWGPADVLQAI
jgi:pyruvate/2-oxoglutarate/acetoin dehydrogenase E1 component